MTRISNYDMQAFQHWWDMKGEWVEPPNLRRGGQSGVQRLESSDGRVYVKRQIGHVYRSWRKPLGEPTIVREARAYEHFTALGVDVPKVEYVGARKVQGQWQALLVTRELTGYCELDQWYQGSPNPNQRQSMLVQLAKMLKKMHQGRWQHGCLYAKHIFVKSEGDLVQVALLDLEKCRQRRMESCASKKDLSQLRRHKGLMPDEDYRYLLEAYQS